MKNFRKLLMSVFLSAVMAVSSMPAMSASGAEQETKLIALTFDDGPNTTTTNEVLDILEEYHAKASFFLIGTNINAESAVSVKRAYDMGMEIDNHSKTHSNMAAMSLEDIQAEVAYVDEKVVEITGEATKFFRPPFIDTSQTMYDAIELPFICGIDCQDYMENVTAEERAQYILNGAKDGVIVLLHDAAGNSQTVEALKIVMPELTAQGYEFVTLTELFERQGETPKHYLLYSQVAKYPCTDYALYQTVDSSAADKVPLDTAVLEQLGENYAIEVSYHGTTNPPVIALQKWSGAAPVWQAVQPFYSNGEKAVFLASDILPALEALDMTYTDFDGITISAYGGEIILSDAKILTKPETSEQIAGDVNQDGNFNLTDIITFQKWLLGSGNLNNWKAADFTGDKMLNIYDLILMKKALLS